MILFKAEEVDTAVEVMEVEVMEEEVTEAVVTEVTK